MYVSIRCSIVARLSPLEGSTRVFCRRRLRRTSVSIDVVGRVDSSLFALMFVHLGAYEWCVYLAWSPAIEE